MSGLDLLMSYCLLGSLLVKFLFCWLLFHFLYLHCLFTSLIICYFRFYLLNLYFLSTIGNLLLFLFFYSLNLLIQIFLLIFFTVFLLAIDSFKSQIV
jgi:hypothetical protein